MIPADAQLTIQKLPLSTLLVWEYQKRYPKRLRHYIRLLKAHPTEYAGAISVAPSTTYPGLYDVLDGYHRFTASIIVGRPDILALVIAPAGAAPGPAAPSADRPG